MENKFKRLAIISDCVHAYDPSQKVITENHIFCRQMQSLASMFEHTIICCPFISYSKKMIATAYTSSNINFIALPKVGGNSIKHKLKVLKALPAWFRAFKKANSFADVVYQRFPNNLNIPGFFYFLFKRAKTFATYTGAWDYDPYVPFTSRLQIWLLRNFFRGPVWAYTCRENKHKRIIAGYSPSYSLAEWNEEADQIEKRIIELRVSSLQTLKLITVGSLCERKNTIYIVKTCVLLREQKIPFQLLIVGEGEKQSMIEAFLKENNLCDCVKLCGKVHHNDLKQLYRESDFIVQSPISEGFGKIVTEGFFHGLIPIISSSSMMANSMTRNGERGFVFNISEPGSLCDVLFDIFYNVPSEKLSLMIQEGRKFVHTQTLENWSTDYINTINEYY